MWQWNYEHLYILPSRWLCLLKFETIGEEVYKIWNFVLYANRVFCWEKILIFGIPKSTVLVIIFRIFIWLLSFKNAKKNHYPFADIRNGISKKRTRSSYNETMNNGTSLSSSDYETTPKFKKSLGENINAK